MTLNLNLVTLKSESDDSESESGDSESESDDSESESDFNSVFMNLDICIF